MLDDLKYIHERDAQDALGINERQWQQLQYVYDVDFSLREMPDQVVVAGMGGSALAAQLAASWPGLIVPYEVVRAYDIPSYVGPKTLFVASSYSGNTEETLAALAAAEKKGAQVVVLASGGALVERAEEKNYPAYRIPVGLQPRMAVFYNLAALVRIFTSARVTSESSVQELHQAGDWLKIVAENWTAVVPASRNRAKQIAQECMGKSAVVYSGPKFYPVAYKWKINFNENAKNIAWSSSYPEFNHNEFLGWTSHPVEKPYQVIDLRSNLEHERVRKRFEISEKLLSGKRPAALVVVPEGETLLQQLLWTIVLGDFVSLYLALLNGLNPTPVDLIEKLKKELAE